MVTEGQLSQMEAVYAAAERERQILRLLDQANALFRAAEVMDEHNDAGTGKYLRGRAMSLRTRAAVMRGQS